MSEGEPTPPPVKGWGYEGFKPMFVLDPNNSGHIAGFARIDMLTAGDTEYDTPGGPCTSPDDAREYLQGIVTDPSDIRFGQKPAKRFSGPSEIGLGAQLHSADKPVEVPSDSEFFDKIMAIGDIREGDMKGYVYILRPDKSNATKEEFELYENEGFIKKAGKYLEVSYVDADPDDKRDPRQIADALMQATYATVARYVGKEVGELLTDEEITKIDQELTGFGYSGSVGPQDKAREGLELAGFHIMKKDADDNPVAIPTTEDGDFIHVLSLRELHAQMKARANPTS